MKIGIDINAVIFDSSGFGRYTYNLVKNILRLDRKNEYVLYANFVRKNSLRRKIIEQMVRDSGAKRVKIKVSRLPARYREWLFGLPIEASRILPEKIDLYFAPHFAGVPRRGNFKKIVAIHDLVFMHFPAHRGERLSNFYLKRTEQAIDQADQIVAVSASTKKDLVDLLAVPAKKIQVVYEGVDKAFFAKNLKDDPRAHLARYFDPSTKYFLCVGTIEPRKNLILAVKAFCLLPREIQKKYKLVFVGPNGWNSSPLEKAIKNHNLTDRVIFTGFVLDEDLSYIYKEASLFIYPSLYEGFGLPILEALAAGAPVLSASNSSLVEVLGKAGWYFESNSEEDLAAKIKKVLASKKKLEFKSRGYRQAGKFSWELAAKKMIAIFEKQKVSRSR